MSNALIRLTGRTAAVVAVSLLLLETVEGVASKDSPSIDASARITFCHQPGGDPARAQAITTADPLLIEALARNPHDFVMGPGDSCPRGSNGGTRLAALPPDAGSRVAFSLCDARTGETGRLIHIGQTGRLTTSRQPCN